MFLPGKKSLKSSIKNLEPAASKSYSLIACRWIKYLTRSVEEKKLGPEIYFKSAVCLFSRRFSDEFFARLYRDLSEMVSIEHDINHFLSYKILMRLCTAFSTLIFRPQIKKGYFVLSRSFPSGMCSCLRSSLGSVWGFRLPTSSPKAWSQKRNPCSCNPGVNWSWKRNYFPKFWRQEWTFADGNGWNRKSVHREKKKENGFRIWYPTDVHFRMEV